jgi:hypothetical protein
MRTPLHRSLKRPLQRPLTLTHGLGYPGPQDASRRPNTRRKRPQEMPALVEVEVSALVAALEAAP